MGATVMLGEERQARHIPGRRQGHDPVPLHQGRAEHQQLLRQVRGGLAGAPHRGRAEAGDGVDAALLGTTTRKDGTMQVTYNGWPLYYYVKDPKPGDVTGQDVGEVWYVLSAKGETDRQRGRRPRPRRELGATAGQTITMSVKNFAFNPKDLSCQPRHHGDLAQRRQRVAHRHLRHRTVRRYPPQRSRLPIHLRQAGDLPVLLQAARRPRRRRHVGRDRRGIDTNRLTNL